MSAPDINNWTPYAFTPLYLTEEEGRPICAAVVKGTFVIEGGGRVRLADAQIPINLAGKYWGVPGQSSYRYEPETAFVKLATDVVLVGAAHAPRPGANAVDVHLQVGPLRKVVRVFGDRYWSRGLAGVSMTSAQPFERIPLTYENAYGGWDRTGADAARHSFEPRNPVGNGFAAKNSFQEGMKLPNLEDPAALIQSHQDTPVPAGFGFISPQWQPRSSHAGTYDKSWRQQRMPLLPRDFNRRFFSAASPGLVATDYLLGNESVAVANASPEGMLAFTLPGVPPPQCDIEIRRRGTESPPARLDTVIVDLDARLVLMIWRSYVAIPEGPHNIAAIDVHTDAYPKAPAPSEP
jgi:hypothetical protein